VDAPIIHWATLSKDLAVWRIILEDEASETDLPDLVDFLIRAIPEAAHIVTSVDVRPGEFSVRTERIDKHCISEYWHKK
jgi:hypothetical protein